MFHVLMATSSVVMCVELLLLIVVLGLLAGSAAQSSSPAEIPQRLGNSFSRLARVATPAVTGNAPIEVPGDVLDYLSLESEEWARAERKSHAVELYQQLGDWKQVLQELRREDGELR